MSDAAFGRQIYNPHRRCPKCGETLVTSSHTKLYGMNEDVIRRRCTRCDATWDEIPLDRAARAAR